jgi:preprotein translocase subunit SecA
MERFGVEEDIPIEAGIVSKSIENAQGKVEGHNFDIRKQLLKYDDVVNQQREVMYAERRRILASSSLKASIQNIVEEEISRLVHNFMDSDYPEEWDLPALHSAIRTIMPLPATLTSASWENQTPAETEEQLLDLALKNYEEMEEVIGSDELRQAEKRLMLQVVDTLWVRHLTALDALRQGIGLRAVGQQDPLIAYKKEAFEMFGQLKEAIKEEVVRRIYHPTIIREAPRPKNIQAVHPSAAAASRQAETPGATSQPTTPIRVAKTLGRNELCWCGSGKKYKHCHMKSDLVTGDGAGAASTATNGMSSRDSAPPVGSAQTRDSAPSRDGAQTRNDRQGKKKRAHARRR